MKIVLLGFDFTCPNKGCEALSYAFMNLLEKILPKEKIEIYNITYKTTLGRIPEIYSNFNFINCRIHLRKPNYYLNAYSIMKNADFIFDITYGDSFSDIYGKKWLIKTNIHKQLAIWSHNKFVMLPQTYGPFTNVLMRKWSLYLIRNADLVYSRDGYSIDYMRIIGKKDVDIVTDLAFALPYERGMYKLESKKIKVGLNPSSLLWEGGFTKENQFGLTVDYQEYCRNLVQDLERSGQYEIHLISHVIEDTKKAPENDLRICKILHEEFPNTIIAPIFSTPIEAKSYICHMDVFSGARMHATIAAFSSGVATIPFSYSRKFEGLYDSLGYSYVISGKKNTTEEAIKKTMKYIQNRDSLKIRADKSMQDVYKKLTEFESEIKKLWTLK